MARNGQADRAKAAPSGNLSNFSQIKHGWRPRLLISATGHEKTGKTTFGISAPGPIALLDFDQGLEGTVEPFIGQKKILVATYEFARRPGECDRDEWRAVRDRFESDYLDALASPSIRTVVVDTMTEVWELERLAEFGRLEQVKPHHYGPANAWMNELVNRAKQTDKNVIFIHKVSREYINDMWTGKYERAGYKNIPYLVFANVETLREGPKFSLHVVNCKHRMILSGKTLTGRMATFSGLAGLVFPDTDPSEWE